MPSTPENHPSDIIRETGAGQQGHRITNPEPTQELAEEDVGRKTESDLSPEYHFSKMISRLDAISDQQNSMLGRSGSVVPDGSSLLGNNSTIDSYEEQVETFRTDYRPMTPILHILDDNQATAELFRMRSERVIIGRTRGAIQIPNDPHVSERHVEIRRELEKHHYSWVLSDLESTNGVYVRVMRHTLEEGDCVLFGCRYFRFEKNTIRGDSGNVDRYGFVEFGRRDKKSRVHTISDVSENVIGNGQPDALKTRWEDPFLNRRHARVACQEGGVWTLEDLNSRNGTWVKVRDKLYLENGMSFQLGGQRFVYSIFL